MGEQQCKRSHERAVAKLERDEQRTKVVHLWNRGHSFRAIGRILGISTTTAWERVDEVRRELAEVRHDKAAEVQDFCEASLLEVIAAAWIDRQNHPDEPKYLEIILKATEKLARMFGVFDPERRESNGRPVDLLAIIQANIGREPEIVDAEFDYGEET